MSEYSDDIARYHAGKMTPAEMHALEKKALSDPFLADALEGAGSIPSNDFVADVASLNRRLARGSAKPLFTPLRIAAAVLVVISAGWAGLYLLDDAAPTQLTMNKESTGPSSGDGAKDSAAANTSEPAESATEEPKPDKLIAQQQPKEKKEEQAKPAAREEARPAASLAEAEDIVAAEEVIVEADRTQVLDSVLTQPSPQQAPTVAAIDAIRSSDEGRLSRRDRSAGAAKMADDGGAQIITGKVTLADDGIALPGVNVRVKGSSKGTVTDLNGKYSIDADTPETTLVFSFIGLETKEATATSGATLDVSLTDDVSQLSEVVVTGKKIPANLDGEPIIKLAEPVGGYKAYDKYLDTNLRYPQTALDNNVKGRVTVQFTVGIDGSVGEFTVMKSLGFGCDEEVIRLVREGPAWIPTTENSVPTESLVRVRMKFDAAKVKKK